MIRENWHLRTVQESSGGEQQVTNNQAHSVAFEWA
jgi:hypothetical protein